MPDSAAFQPTMTGTPSAGSTLPRPSVNGTAPSPPAPPRPVPRRLAVKVSGGRARLIGAGAVCVVAIIFAIQNIHAANISFLGIHLLLPLAVALFLAAVAGSVLTIAAGPARTAQVRKFLHRGQPRPDAAGHGTGSAPAA
jgi:lipopolysaccharide assembly protein A